MWKLLFYRSRRDDLLYENPASGQPMWRRLDRSPVPAILMLVLVWSVVTVLLTLSALRLRDSKFWKSSGKAPFTLYAEADFSYVDSAATERARAAARQQVPLCYRIVGERSENIKKSFENFVREMTFREESEKSGKVYSGNEFAIGKRVAGFSRYQEFLKLYRTNGNTERFQNALARLMQHGVAGSELQAAVGTGAKMRIFASETVYRDEQRPDPRGAAAILLNSLAGDNANGAVPLSAKCVDEFSAIAAAIFDGGNLAEAPSRSAEERAAAAARVKPIVLHRSKGELLVEKNSPVGQDVIDMLNAEREKIPDGYGMKIFYFRSGVSFILLIFVVLLVVFIYPELLRFSRNIMMCGTLIIICMIASFYGLKIFYHLLSTGRIANYSLMSLMLPITLTAAISGVLMGNRAAMFNILLVSCLSALMVTGENSLALVVRCFFSGAIVTLAVGHVSNYRSFFVRVFLTGAAAAIFSCGDMLIYQNYNTLRQFAILVLFNNFCCAISALLLVFVFELFFNSNTNMSLMVLCDYNHPLLEKLKREAPGTMFHSITVATLAEDAARAIHLNPLKTKAGALFHDIGKLASPQHFVENNSNSPAEYEKMPPKRCSSIIRGHVTSGLELAREYRLSGFIRDAIATHHGDDLVSFFYQRALKEAADNPAAPQAREEDYHYSGPVPDSKELTIISLADACEAACRSLTKPSPEQIKKMVGNIFMHRLDAGQLRQSPLTLHELLVIRESFIANLISFHHGRIDYKKEEKRSVETK